MEQMRTLENLRKLTKIRAELEDKELQWIKHGLRVGTPHTQMSTALGLGKTTLVTRMKMDPDKYAN